MVTAFKEGMYVRCPLDQSYPEEPRLFIMGQIMDINKKENTVEVLFHDLENIGRYYEFVPKSKVFDIKQISRTKILPESRAEVRGKNWVAEIINFAQQSDEGFNEYYVEVLNNEAKQIKKISEYYLDVMFNRADARPMVQMAEYELHNPFWFQRRKIVSESMHILKNATYGFETLVGSRVYLLPHQVDTIVRAISDSKCRLMLADEVGLGKTIEACVIMKGLRQRLGNLRVLVIAPRSLVHQWQNELSYKFWEEVPVWPGGDAPGGDLIFPLESVAAKEGQEVLLENWDLIIVDETHRLLHMPAVAYNEIKELSSRTEHILLLTATPIQYRRTEYLKLLLLLQPQRYNGMNEEDFDKLLGRQEMLLKYVHRMTRDLPEYFNGQMGETYLNYLKEIQQALEDPGLAEIIGQIDLGAPDAGMVAVRLALAYISEHYQIERRILRHRRAEVEELQIKRQLEYYSYKMSGADYSFYELETYNLLLGYLDSIKEHAGWQESHANYFKALLAAMFSSPWALRLIIECRLSIVAARGSLKHGHTTGNSALFPNNINIETISHIPTFKAEQDQLRQLLEKCRMWQEATVDELERIEELINYPERCRGRLSGVLSYLSDTSDNDKFVIFSTFPQTLIELEKVMIKLFGQNAVAAFYRGVEQKELQRSADRFQGDPLCRFILCDELGGEGRNFQMASAVLHVDMPWEPVALEQRIGRLDRIGRKGDVISIVFCAEGSLEEDLFALWNKGLNIFKESLSGIEIALYEINCQISKAFKEDISYGLGNVLGAIGEQLEVMRDLVEEERYFDLARQLDGRVRAQLSRLIDKFDANGGEELQKTMLSWGQSAGLFAMAGGNNETIFKPGGFQVNAMKNVMLTPPNMEKAWDKARHTQQIKGTFSREIAINKENLVFFSPGEPFFDSITGNAQESYRGRSCAYAIKWDLPVSWQGLIYIWTAGVGPNPLLEMGEGRQKLALARGYLPLEPIMTMECISDDGQSIEDEVIKKWVTESLRQRGPNKIAHLGKRSPEKDFLNINGRQGKSNLQWLKEYIPRKEWKRLLRDSYKASGEKVKKTIREESQWAQAEYDFQRQLAGIRASLLYYYGVQDEVRWQDYQRRAQIYEALLKGIKHPQLSLESVALVWMVGNNE